MNHFPRSRRARTAALVWGLSAAAWVALAAPYPIERVPWLELRGRPFVVRGDATLDLAPFTLAVPPDGPARSEIRLPAGLSGSAPRTVTVEAAGAAAEEGGIHRFVLRSSFTRADGTPVRAERSLEIRDGATGFFEAGHGPGWRLTVAITADRTERPTVRPPSGGVAPFLFRLEVGRVVAGEFIAVESNELSTFLGQPVEYSFRIGDGETLERLRLVLTPKRVEGDLAELGISLSGVLRAGRDAPLELDRAETLWTDRGTMTEVSAADGEPADGFRFRVTPVW